MIDFRPVIAADGGRRVEQHRQQVFFDVCNLGRVLQEAFHHVLQMRKIQLQELALHKLLRVFGFGSDSVDRTVCRYGVGQDVAPSMQNVIEMLTMQL